MKKQFILNADDFGLSYSHNRAVAEGYKTDILTSASLCVNTDAFYDAINNIIPECPNLGIGVHLNVMEGRSLTCCTLLTDEDKTFYGNYLYLIKNQNENAFLKEIEKEFRAQIEKCLEYNIKIDHLDSHMHIHAIPAIFEITCKLAEEYNIKYVRTQYEKPYFVFLKCLSLKYFINLIKMGLLSYYTKKNIQTLKSYKLKTNDNIIGIGYTGMMDSKTIYAGLKKFKNSELIEAIIHPCLYKDNMRDNHSVEFEITQDERLKENILKLDVEFTNYSRL